MSVDISAKKKILRRVLVRQFSQARACTIVFTRTFRHRRRRHLPLSLAACGQPGDRARFGTEDYFLRGICRLWHLAEADEETISSKLERSMKPYCVLSAGVVAFLSGRELTCFVNEQTDFRPALVIVHDGRNDFRDSIYRDRKADKLGFSWYFLTWRKLSWTKTIERGSVRPRLASDFRGDKIHGCMVSSQENARQNRAPGIFA
jgi:hypothetical protein